MIVLTINKSLSLNYSPPSPCINYIIDCDETGGEYT